MMDEMALFDTLRKPATFKDLLMGLKGLYPQMPNYDRIMLGLYIFNCVLQENKNHDAIYLAAYTVASIRGCNDYDVTKTDIVDLIDETEKVILHNEQIKVLGGMRKLESVLFAHFLAKYARAEAANQSSGTVLVNMSEVISEVHSSMGGSIKQYSYYAEKWDRLDLIDVFAGFNVRPNIDYIRTEPTVARYKTILDLYIPAKEEETKDDDKVKGEAVQENS
jgi:hypothetical protein